MYRFSGITESHEFSLYVDQPKEKSILIRLILVTVLVTGFFSFVILLCNDNYLLLLQERIAGEHKVFEEGMDLFSSSGLFEGIKATYETKTGEGAYCVEEGLLVGGRVIDFTKGPFKCPYENCYTYMGWQMIAAKQSNQGSFILSHFKDWINHKWSYINSKGNTVYISSFEKHPEAFDEEGFGRVDGRYVVATTLKNDGGIAKVGDKLDVYLENGEIIRCIVGDIKSSGDPTWTKWGHLDKIGGKHVSTIEFIVNRDNTFTEQWYKLNSDHSGRGNHDNPGTLKCHPEWKSQIVKIMVGGTESTGTSAATSGWKYMPTSWIKKANIDTSKLSAKRQTIIDCMYWIVWNCYYDQDLGSNNHPGTSRRDNFDTILDDIAKTGYSGADCSSSIHAAYNKVGIAVPSTTGGYPTQTSKKIDKDDLAPGDILWKNKHVVMFLGWKDKSSGKIWYAAMHDIGRQPWKDKTGKESGSIADYYNISDFAAAYRFTPVGSGISTNASTVTSATGSTSSVTAQQSESTMLVGNQIVVSACKQLGLSVKGSGSAEYVYNVKDSNWIYFAKEHTGLSYLNSKKDIIVSGLEAGMPLIILTGTNDTGKASKISELANSFGSKGTVYVCTLPPVSSSCSSVSNSDITTFNNTIKTGAQKYKVLDLHSYCSIEGIKSSDGSTNYSKSDALKMLKWIKEQMRR